MQCGGKGSQLLESLETVFGTDSVLKKIRTMLREHAYHSFSMDNFLSLLRYNIVDSVDLAQIYEFWFRSAGITNLRLEQIDERLRLTQMNISGFGRHATLLSPLRIAIRNLSLPVSFMLSQGLELAPLDSKLLPLTNLGYAHIYRVNYDTKIWERILRHLEESPQLFSPRAKAQILNDFCYFGALNEIGAEFEMLKKGFLQLMRSEYEHFELCEFYVSLRLKLRSK
jgi:aminopeptidase N